jgi:hypothetical protein
MYFFLSLYYRHIVGKRGDTKKKIEVETKTSINIPKHGHEGEIGETSHNLHLHLFLVTYVLHMCRSLPNF